jgi:hypothetical protein
MIISLRRYRAPAFALWELIAVVAVILVAVAIGFWLLRRQTTSVDDELRVYNVRAIRRSLVAASQQSLVLVGCVTGDPIKQCRVCTSDRCREADDKTQTYLPPALFAPDADRPDACRSTSAQPCAWAIEQDGPAPLSITNFRLRFFIEHATGDATPAGNRVLNGFGTIE